MAVSCVAPTTSFGSLSHPTFVRPRSIPSTLLSLSSTRRGSGDARLDFVSGVASTTRSSPVVLCRSTRATNSKQFERKITKKKEYRGMEIHVSCAHATMTKTTKSCVSTHGWERGEEPAGRACLAMAGGLGWLGGSLRGSVHVPTTRRGAFAAAKEPRGVAEPSSSAFSLANRALRSVSTAEVSISIDATSFPHVAVTCFPSTHPVHCSTTTRSTAPRGAHPSWHRPVPGRSPERIHKPYPN